MKIKPEHLEQLEKEVQYIFDSGANEIRVYEMIQTFIERRGKALFIPVVSISSLAEKAKEEERLNREKMITNYNTPLDKIQPYENKHLLALIDEILKELN